MANKEKGFWEAVLWNLQDGLEKGTVGTITMFCCMGCIFYLTIHEKGSTVVESLISTAMIVAATLMGVNSVTDIFKQTKTCPPSK